MFLLSLREGEILMAAPLGGVTDVGAFDVPKGPPTGFHQTSFFALFGV